MGAVWTSDLLPRWLALGHGTQTCTPASHRERSGRRLCHDVFGVSLDVQQRLAAEGVLLPSSDRQSLPTADWRAFYQSRHRTLSDLSGERLAFMYAEVQARLER